MVSQKIIGFWARPKDFPDEKGIETGTFKQSSKCPSFPIWGRTDKH
jgi:hypothetical protein